MRPRAQHTRSLLLQPMRWCLVMCLLFLGGVGYGQIITTFAGNGTLGCSGFGGFAIMARINDPLGCAFKSNGDFYFANQQCNLVCKIDLAGGITIVAGGGSTLGDGLAATSANFSYPNDITFDTGGNILVVDGMHFRIRKINAFTGVISTIAGTGVIGFGGDGGPATSAQISGVNGICVDKRNNIYISDCGNNRIRKIDGSGLISTYAGTGIAGFSGDGGLATSAKLNSPFDLAIDQNGVIFFPDALNKRIRKVDTNGIITTVAGCDSVAVFNGDGIVATAAHVGPYKIAVDSFGNIYFSDSTERIRWIDTFGIIRTIAGTGISGFSGDGGPSDSAEIFLPSGLAVDPCGNICFGDVGNNRIRKVYMHQSVVDTPSISISCFSDTICSGGLTAFSSSTSCSLPSYQWFVNSTPISGATGGSYSYIPSNGDSVRCKVFSANPCSYPVTVFSNTIYMVVNPVVTPSISIAASTSDTICSGTSVTYTATTTGGGSAPTYQWLVNGAVVGTGTSHTYTPANGDTVRCIFTSSSPCAVPNLLGSNAIHMVVHPTVVPSIGITASPGDTVCGGTVVTYNATIIGGGAMPGLHWLVNGVSVGTGASYAYAPANGDTVSCTLVSSAVCAVPDTVNSNIEHMVVYPTVTPAISIVPSPDDTFCVGVNYVTISSAISNGGASPVYHWYHNGASAGTGIGYALTPANGDSVSCTLTSSAVCASPVTVASNTIHFAIIPATVPTITITGVSTASLGSTVTITATLSSTGSGYNVQWYNCGTLFATTTVPTVNYTKTLPIDTITARVVPTGFCYDSALSNALVVVDDNLGVGEIAGVSGISIWPNPTTGLLQINSPQPATYKLMDLVGKALQTGTLTTPNTTLDLAKLPNGVYILIVLGDSGDKVIKRIIKE